jgi:transmembrane sensor
VIDERDLIRLIEGDCSPDEAAAIQAWVAADPKRGELLNELRAVWLLTGTGKRTWDVASARRRLIRAYNARPAEQQPSALPAAAARNPWRDTLVWTRRVALASCVAAFAIILDAKLRPGEEAPEREYVTSRGQRATVSLVDGTRVLLSVDTKLRVQRGYGTRGRGVELEGEAYFIVRRNDMRPFVVRTARGTARDLGTEFAVRDYRREPYLQLVVAEGTVELFNNTPNDSGAKVDTLRPRDRATIDDRYHMTVVSDVPLEPYVSWTRGRLVFDDEPLSAVTARLERWYDLQIAVADPSLGGERVTISFETESADEALSALAKVLDVRMTRTGRSVRLAPGSRSPATTRGE